MDKLIKTETRNKYREIRNKLDLVYIESASESIEKNALSFFKNTSFDGVLLYAPLGKEVKTDILFGYFKNQNIPCFFPKVVSDSDMNFYLVNNDTLFIKGAFNIDEPEETRDFKDIYLKSGKYICFLPGICFDLKGHRCGYGKGYYDKFLSEFSQNQNIFKAALCYEKTLAPEFESDEFDINADIIFTEKGFYECT